MVEYTDSQALNTPAFDLRTIFGFTENCKDQFGFYPEILYLLEEK